MLRQSIFCLLAWVSITLPSAPVSASEILAHERYRLDNGLDVILHVDRTLPIVAMNLAYPVGSMHDGDALGLAHLTEHLMFRGTRDIDDGMHEALLQDAGASLNAHTHVDRTYYHCVLPTNQLPLALWLESNRMAHMLAALDETKVEEEIKTTSDEWRSDVEAKQFGDAFMHVLDLLFPHGHPRHDVRPNDIAQLRLEQVREFVSHYHGPAHATLVLAGDLPTDVRAQVERYFGHREGGQLPPTPQFVQSDAPGERVIRIQRGTAPTVTIAWTSPPRFEPGDADADVLASVLDERLWATSERLSPGEILTVHVEQSSTGGQSVFLIFAVGATTAEPDHILATLDAAWTDLQHEPLVDDLHRAKQQWRVETLASVQSMSGRANRMQLYVASGKLPDWLDEDLARYAAVDPGSIASLLEGHLHPANRVVVLTEPVEVAP